MSYTETIRTYEGVIAYLCQKTHTHQFRRLPSSNPHSLTIDLEPADPLRWRMEISFEVEYFQSKLAMQCALLTPPVKTLRLLCIKTSTTTMLAVLAKCPLLQHLAVGEDVCGRVDRSWAAVQAAREAVRNLKSLTLQLERSSVRFKNWLLESVGPALLKMEVKEEEKSEPSELSDLDVPVRIPAQCTRLQCLIAWLYVPRGLEAHYHSLRILVANQWPLDRLCDVIGGCFNLEEVYGRGWNKYDDFGGLYVTVARLPRLQHFGFKDLPDGVEDFIGVLAHVGPRLKGLQLAHKWVNASVLKAVGLYCENLEYVSILDMDDVENDDYHTLHPSERLWSSRRSREFSSSAYAMAYTEGDVVEMVKACKRLRGLLPEIPLENPRFGWCNHVGTCHLAVALKKEGLGKVWSKAGPGLPFEDMED
ncbi:hypothetical protein HK097_011311 [Rhizophlyctis rosea]|uniref:Uncharacterized protein n=1 Tax=Rhizophlyctis rosea TaxID=64517 RepID=A0AAD5SJS9_9FUNG|nr:hypothetical protein HK097_011311 [Rhizophlyctis rosea]